MRLEVKDKVLELLNEQTEERTAERLVYNSSDILKRLVHLDIELNDNSNIFRIPGIKVSIKKGTEAEIKLALAHVVISTCVLIKQMKINQFELEGLIEECIKDHNGEWG